jgi:hypothetical protein
MFVFCKHEWIKLGFHLGKMLPNFDLKKYDFNLYKIFSNGLKLLDFKKIKIKIDIF